MPIHYDFFIAHASADKPAARDLRQQLGQRGHTAFVDAEDAPPGALWDQVIPEAQRNSRVTLVIVSPRSGEGYYDKEEIAAAIHLDRGDDHPVVPVVLDAVAVPEAMPYGLRRRVAMFPERDGWPLVVDRLCALVGDFAPPASVRAQLIELEKAIAKKPSNIEALRSERKALRQQMAAGETLEPGRIFAGRYQLEGLLGQGGFGQVWRAFDIDDGRFVALKILHRDLDQRRRNRFKTGIRKQKGLKHTHIAPVISGAHTDAHRTYAVLALLEGGDLAQALNEGRLDGEQVPPLIRSVADALTYAHEGGVIHRDVKPSNLLLDDRGVVYLTDFDLVRADDTGGESHTRGVGTVLYLAPEALDEHGKVTPATDQYALAMTAVCLLSGRSLPARTIYNRQAAVKALKVSDAAKGVLLRGIEDEPRARWPSIKAFAEALAAAMDRRALSPTGTAGTLPASGVGTPREARPASTLAPSQPTRLPGLVMVPIPGGTFLMGSPPGVGRDDEHPQHSVTLSPFLLSATTVTQAQYQAVTSANPSQFKGDDRPVEQVSWEEAVDFCNALSRREGLQSAYDAQRTLIPNTNGYRLPTEAQWEYACRAGTTTRWFHGDDEAGLEEYAWYSKKGGRETHSIAQKRPNAFGLFDMHGNVWEWCHDWRGAFPGVSQAEPIGAPRGDHRVVRGGSYWDDAGRCRSACRLGYLPGVRDGYLGFRLVRPAPAHQATALILHHRRPNGLPFSPPTPDELTAIVGGPVAEVRLSADLPEGFDFDWQAVAREMRAQLQASQARLSSPVHFFGVSFIPLLVDLGAAFGSHFRTIPYHLHHGHRDWAAPPGEGIQVKVVGLPEAPSDDDGPIVFRVSTSYEVHEADTRAVVPRSSAEIHLRLADRLGPDAVRSPEAVASIAQSFRNALDRAVQLRPRAKHVDLFLSVSTGIAFELGRMRNPTVHPPFQTWQYMREASPRYRPAVRIG